MLDKETKLEESQHLNPQVNLEEGIIVIEGQDFPRANLRTHTQL